MLSHWNLDSNFQSLVEFRIPLPEFCIPSRGIPDSTSKNFPHSGIRKTLHHMGRAVIPSLCIKRFCLFIYPIQADERMLNILTYVGLTLSLIGITSTIICYAFLTCVLIFKSPIKSVFICYTLSIHQFILIFC